MATEPPRPAPPAAGHPEGGCGRGAGGGRGEAEEAAAQQAGGAAPGPAVAVLPAAAGGRRRGLNGCVPLSHQVAGHMYGKDKGGERGRGAAVRRVAVLLASVPTCGRERRGIPGAAGVGAARGCVTAVGRSRRGVPALLPAEGGSERAAVVPFPSGRSAMTAVRSGRRSRRAPGSRGSASVDLMP